MRKALLLAGLICATILFTANTHIGESAFYDFFSLVDYAPVLPQTPYDYENVELPPHLEETDWGFNDDTAFDVISNDGATLGRVLFYDQLLSANNNLSCATCHSQELSFADASPFSTGVSEETDVNSMHLNDLGWSNRVAFFWDLSEHNLAEMIALPLTNPNEIGLTDMEDLVAKMEQTSYYPDLFTNAFGSSMISQKRIQTALMEFISSMTTFESRFDQHKKGLVEFTDSEKLGESIFVSNCGICHTDGNSVLFGFNPPGTPFEPSGFGAGLFNNGLPLAEGDQGAGDWNSELTGLFKAPTLRNIEKTGPYMHDGRFATLEEVVDHYSTKIEPTVNDWGSPLPVGGFQFSVLEKQGLVDFMKTFTDESFLVDDKFSDPFESPLADEEPLATFYEVKLFPNPAVDVVNISFDNPARQLVDVYLMSIDGKVLRKMSTHLDGLSTDISQLASGSYIIRVMRSDKDWLDEKLIVQ